MIVSIIRVLIFRLIPLLLFLWLDYALVGLFTGRTSIAELRGYIISFFHACDGLVNGNTSEFAGLFSQLRINHGN